MCGRFTLTRSDVDALARELGAEVERESALLYRPRWNVAPTQPHWIVRLDGRGRRLLPARFGVGVGTGDGRRLVVNARSETAAELPTFRSAMRDGRCVVPTDGFFEWQGGRGARRPLWFHPPGGGLLLLAGLVLEHHGERAFVILTTAANDPVRRIHDRMPVVLSQEGAAAWLSAPDATLLVPAPEAWLAWREVSEAVNDVAKDGPSLLDPASPPRQLTLV